MEVILNKSVENLGRAGVVVKVKNGYARNYLLPKNIALAASPENLNLISKIQERQKAVEEKERLGMMALAEKLQKVPCKIEVLVGEEGKMFGSVTAQDIAKLFKDAGFTVEKKKIHLKNPIKTVGEHEAEIKLSVDVTTFIKVTVTGKENIQK